VNILNVINKLSEYFSLWWTYCISSLTLLRCLS